MKILIIDALNDKGVKIYRVVIQDSQIGRAWLDDEAHSNLGEVEARARADALRAVTGWEIVKEYES